MSTCKINETHCENCGSTDFEDVMLGDDRGYTACCNEPKAYCRHECPDYHGQNDRIEAAIDDAVRRAGYKSREDWLTRDEAGWDRTVDHIFETVR